MGYPMPGGPDDKCTHLSCSPHPVPALHDPDPGYKGTRFIAWLKKRGAVQRLSKCMIKWSREGLDIERTVNRMGTANIDIYRSSGGEKVVVLKNKVWADQWMIHYGLEIPHHAQPARTKIKLSQSETKGNV
jgi:hypothetical protein